MANSTITPSAGVVMLTTDQAPMIGIGTVTLTGNAPTVTSGTVTLIAPGAGAVSVSGNAPMVTKPLVTAIAPNAGAVAVSGVASTLGLVIAPSAGAVAISGVSASLSLTIAPGAVGIALAGVSPTLLPGTVMVPVAASVAYGAVAPIRIIGTVMSLPVAAVTLAGAAPSITGTATVIISPLAGRVSVQGNPSILAFGLAPATAVTTFVGAAPRSTSSTLTATGAVVLSGARPAVTIAYGPLPQYLAPAAAQIPTPAPTAQFLLPQQLAA